MSTMTELRTRHVLVIHDSAIVGIVSIGDVVKHRLEESMHNEEVLHDYITGTGYH